MEDIALVEVAAQQVIGIRKTGTYRLIPELLMKIYEYSVKKKMVIDRSRHSFYVTRILRKQ